MAISVMTRVWEHSKSRLAARLTLLAIADAANDEGDAYPSNAKLCQKAGISERAVQSAVAELVAMGELEVRYNAGPKGVNVYRVLIGAPRETCTPQNLHPAESAPPQNPHESPEPGESSQVKGRSKGAESAPPQNPHPAGSAPGTVKEDLSPTGREIYIAHEEPPPAKRPKEPKASRATRIPDDFAVTPAMADWARHEIPALIDAGRGQYETSRFVDYYRSASGTNARKTDWPATWRNWMRKADDDYSRNPAAARAPRSAPQSGSDRARDQAEALKLRLAGKALAVTIEETIDLLALAAAFDRRNIGETDTIAWHAALGELDSADTQAAVIAHYRESREFIMPADVWTRVRAMRRDRIAREVAPAPGHELTDSPPRYRAALTGMVKRIGDGLATRLAISGPVREGPPPAEFTTALAALPKPATKQELAAQQAAESRAEREGADQQETGD